MRRIKSIRMTIWQSRRKIWTLIQKIMARTRETWTAAYRKAICVTTTLKTAAGKNNYG